VKVDVTLRSPKLAALSAALSGSKRAQLNEAMAMGVREKTRLHLAALAGTRHATAERLGAAQSGHLTQAARAVEASPVEADAGSATLTINHVGLGRAFHDVRIVPVNAKALAIPVDQIAYARSPRQLGIPMFVFRSKTTGNTFLARRQAEKNERPLLLYLLVRSVTQPQDRTLLPSDQEWQKAAAQSAIDFIHMESGAT
jgi:carboxylesterase type B